MPIIVAKAPTNAPIIIENAGPIILKISLLSIRSFGMNIPIRKMNTTANMIDASTSAIIFMIESWTLPFSSSSCSSDSIGGDEKNFDKFMGIISFL
jgi:hypothetical protein